jgi:hypothetical protein
MTCLKKNEPIRHQEVIERYQSAKEWTKAWESQWQTRLEKAQKSLQQSCNFFGIERLLVYFDVNKGVNILTDKLNLLVSFIKW